MRAKGLELLSGRVKALRFAVHLDNFRLAQHLRMGLAAYLRHLEEPLRNDMALLFEISGLWLRNIGDRRDTKREILSTIRRVLPRLSLRYHGNKGSPGKADEEPRRRRSNTEHHKNPRHPHPPS